MECKVSEREIKKNAVYRDCVGKYFYTICFGYDSNTGERVVVYGSLEHENEIHVKPYWFFASSIDESDAYNVYIEQTYRFEEVSIVPNRITMMLEKYCKDWMPSENEF